MNNAPVISVIIPVYNAGRYLRRSLDSVLRQTLRDIEIVCVDDGSTDDSLAILAEYAGRDSRVRVESLCENGGVGQARNRGIELAWGEYIYFLDSDDWIDPDYLEAMFSHAVSSGQDIVINANWYVEYEKPSKRTLWLNPEFVKEDVFYYSPIEVQKYLVAVVWCRLFKASFLRDNSIRFPLVKSAEDVYFVWLSEILQEKSYIFRGPYYHYFFRRESLSRQKDSIWNHLLNYIELLKSYREKNISPESAKRFLFWRQDRLRINSEERLRVAKAYFESVKDDVLAAPQLYWDYECYVMEAVLSCSYYREWRRRFFFGVNVGFGIRLLRNRRWPTVRELLDGTWVV